MIYETLTITQIAQAIYNDDNANWSYEGAYAIAEYLEDLSDDLGENIELDVVAIRCEYSEYTLEEFVEAYSTYFDWMTDDEREDFGTVVEHIEQYTTVVYGNSAQDIIIVQEF